MITIKKDWELKQDLKRTYDMFIASAITNHTPDEVKDRLFGALMEAGCKMSLIDFDIIKVSDHAFHIATKNFYTALWLAGYPAPEIIETIEPDSVHLTDSGLKVVAKKIITFNH